MSDFIDCKDNLYVLYITEHCNLNCDYCYEGLNKVKKNMSFEKGKEIIDDIMNNLVDPSITARIMLFGGEPFLNWDVFYKLTEYAYNEYYMKDKLIMFSTITNGTLLKPDRIRALFKFHKFLSIHVSVDGDKEAHDAHRVFKSGIGSYDIVIKNVKFLLKYFPFSVIRLVITDVDKFYDNVQALRKLGVRTFTIQALKSEGSASPYYVKRYYEIIEQLKEEFALLNRVEINEYSEPIEDQVEYKKRKSEEAMNTNEEYRYFTTEGDKIFKPTFFEGGFQDFDKGSDASYNTLSKGRKNAIGVEPE